MLIWWPKNVLHNVSRIIFIPDADLHLIPEHPPTSCTDQSNTTHYWSSSSSRPNLPPTLATRQWCHPAAQQKLKSHPGFLTSQPITKSRSCPSSWIVWDRVWDSSLPASSFSHVSFQDWSRDCPVHINKQLCNSRTPVLIPPPSLSLPQPWNTPFRTSAGLTFPKGQIW